MVGVKESGSPRCCAFMFCLVSLKGGLTSTC